MLTNCLAEAWKRACRSWRCHWAACRWAAARGGGGMVNAVGAAIATNSTCPGSLLTSSRGTAARRGAPRRLAAEVQTWEAPTTAPAQPQQYGLQHRQGRTRRRPGWAALARAIDSNSAPAQPPRLETTPYPPEPALQSDESRRGPAATALPAAAAAAAAAAATASSARQLAPELPRTILPCCRCSSRASGPSRPTT